MAYQRVRCASCRRTIGWALGQQALRSSVFCDEACLNETPVIPTEERNELWKVLAGYGFSPVALGKAWGINHSSVYRALR
jgi:hypothetical protein